MSICDGRRITPHYRFVIRCSRSAMLDIAAPLSGQPKDALDGEDVAPQTRWYGRLLTAGSDDPRPLDEAAVQAVTSPRDLVA
jgi:hypothetical protein